MSSAPSTNRSFSLQAFSRLLLPFFAVSSIQFSTAFIISTIALFVNRSKQAFLELLGTQQQLFGAGKHHFRYMCTACQPSQFLSAAPAIQFLHTCIGASPGFALFHREMGIGHSSQLRQMGLDPSAIYQELEIRNLPQAVNFIR